MSEKENERIARVQSALAMVQDLNQRLHGIESVLYSLLPERKPVKKVTDWRAFLGMPPLKRKGRTACAKSS